MFCTKCGKELNDDDKFCMYCGSPVEGNEEETEDLNESIAKPKSNKKWLVLGCVAAGIVVLGCAGVVAVNMTKAKKRDVVKVEQTKKEDKKKLENKEKRVKSKEIVEKQEEEFQTKAFHPDAATEAGLNQFVTALAWADFFGYDQITAYDDGAFCETFLYYAIRMDFDIGRVLNKYSLNPNYQILMSEAEVKEFLQNSLGKSDLSDMRYQDGKIITAEGDPGSRWVEKVVFHNMTQISKTDIRIEGVAYYVSDGEDAGNATFTITMTKNPNSVWGGYMLKNIDHWKRELRGYEASTYVLWSSDSTYYTAERLEYMNSHDLYLARNEIYARHGYIFDSPNLKEYFGAKSWYQPITKNVLDSDLNDYERANVKLILALEKGNTPPSPKAEVQAEMMSPEEAFGEYLFFLVDAINSGDYTGAEKIMLKGSSLYKEQKALVKRLYKKNISEEIKSWSIISTEKIDDTHVRLISDEAILVIYGDGTSKTLYQNYAYTCELSKGKWLFTSISKVE